MSNQFNKSIVKLLRKWLNLKFLVKLQSKFSKLGDLVQGEQQVRKERVTVHPFPGIGTTMDTKAKWLRSGAQAGKKLPNIRDFAIKVMPYDWLFLLFGLLKRFKPRLVFWKWKNDSPNQYLNYMFERLRKQVSAGSYDAAQETMGILMNSSSYLDSSYNYVARNWHRNRPLGLVEKELKGIKTLIRTRATNISYSRVYLDEITKYRPLGVPTVEWRVYLHMYNNLITEWRRISEAGKQHGYLPGLGVLSAGEALLELMDSPHLFEADFKGFFDNVTHSGISSVLRDLGLPFSEIVFMSALNASIVALPVNLKLKETDVDLVGQYINRDLEGQRIQSSKMWADLLTPRPLNVDMGSLAIRKMDGSLALPDVLISNDASGGKLEVKTVGVPQGAPTSCSLATLALRPLESLINCVIYADDGVYAPRTPDVDPAVVVSNPAMGVSANPDKIKWLKKNGKWLVESFKYLGIRCYPAYWVTVKIPERWFRGLHLDLLPGSGELGSYRVGERFIAQTRKGATLSFTHRESLLSYLSMARDGIIASGSAGKYFNSRPLSEGLVYNTSNWSNIRGKARLLGNNRNTGWLVARMFINSGNVKMKQNFHLAYRKDSGMGYIGPIYAAANSLPWDSVSVFTASSFASHDLLRIIHDLDVPKVKRKKLKFRRVRVRSVKSIDKRDYLMSGFRIFNFRKNRK